MPIPLMSRSAILSLRHRPLCAFSKAFLPRTSHLYSTKQSTASGCLDAGRRVWEPVNTRLAPPGFRFGLELDGSQHYTVLSGHGVYNEAAGHVSIPCGTRLILFGTPGSGLTHGFANILERGDGYEVRQLYSAPHKIYNEDDLAPNLCLFPPTEAQPVVNVDGCMNANVKVLVVSKATELKDLLKADMGIVCWAACQFIDGAEGPMFGEEGVWSSDGTYFPRPY